MIASVNVRLFQFLYVSYTEMEILLLLQYQLQKSIFNISTLSFENIPKLQ